MRAHSRRCRRGALRLRAVAALVGLGVATVVVGCAPSASQTATAADKSGIGPINFAIGALDLGTYGPKLVRQWNHAHPHQWVTIIPLPNPSDDQHAQLVANLQTRSSVYDVMALDVIWTDEFAANDWIVPLSRRQFPLKGVLPPAVATGMYADRLFAVPFISNAGLLYYRSDILRAAHDSPPTTWAQLAKLASTLAPKYHIAGYAGQLADYEGLTVNFAEAVQSAGGSILSRNGTKVALGRPATAGLQFLLNGLTAGWIPKAALNWEEAQSADAFGWGKLLFLRNWPYVYGAVAAPGKIDGKTNEVYGKFGVTALPGLNGPGRSVLGGYNLAISAYSKYQKTARAFIKFLTGWQSQRDVLVYGSQPPVLTRLYTNRKLIKKYPYLRTLKKAILSAEPRPQTPNYSQFSLAIQSTIHEALVDNNLPAHVTIACLAKQLQSLLHGGSNMVSCPPA
jgi:multiple sugar transport system substrate-binding protein